MLTKRHLKQRCQIPEKLKKRADGKAGNNIMLDYKIMYVSHTGNTQRLAVCIYQSLQQLGNGDIEEINYNTEPGKSHLLPVWLQDLYTEK